MQIQGMPARKTTTPEPSRAMKGRQWARRHETIRRRGRTASADVCLVCDRAGFHDPLCPAGGRMTRPPMEA